MVCRSGFIFRDYPATCLAVIGCSFQFPDYEALPYDDCNQQKCDQRPDDAEYPDIDSFIGGVQETGEPQEQINTELEYAVCHFPSVFPFSVSSSFSVLSAMFLNTGAATTPPKCSSSGSSAMMRRTNFGLSAGTKPMKDA